MHLKKLSKVISFLHKNILNILLLLVLFSASKHFISSENYIRGVLVDYTLIKVSLLHLILLPTIILLSKDFKNKLPLLVLLFVLVVVNLFFSAIPIYTLNYLFNFIPLILVLFLFTGESFISQKLLIYINYLYILIFVLQFIYRSSIFSYFPMGFYPYKGISPNVDYFSLFGAMYVLPLGNFPHSNVFAAFLSFLNIFNLKNKRFYLFAINLFLITILSSFSAIFFNFILILLSNVLSRKIKYFIALTFIIIFYFYYLFGFKVVSFVERVNQLKIFWILFKQNFLFGLGINNFVSSINFVENLEKRIYILQPIHNIFLLSLAEGGAFFYVIFLFILNKYRVFIYYSPYILFIIVFGFFDHFLITVQQGITLLSLTILLHKSIINNKNV